MFRPAPNCTTYPPGSTSVLNRPSPAISNIKPHTASQSPFRMKNIEMIKKTPRKYKNPKSNKNNNVFTGCHSQPTAERV